uniref:Uncharacterized protein n=1 Tax=Fundulus heteroclitus TaxID=8078 RepID=A0A3Q2QGW9_FUNHE
MTMEMKSSSSASSFSGPVQLCRHREQTQIQSYYINKYISHLKTTKIDFISF